MHAMGDQQKTDWAAQAASALEWWRDAGVDALIDEVPRQWLAATEPVAALARPDLPAPASPPTTAALPTDIAQFAAWRVGPDAPEARWGQRPVAPAGDPASALMILVDMPEREDGDAGMLIAGVAGKLFDRMLAAIGHDRASVYLVPLCTVRPPAGRIPAEMEPELARIARNLVALAAPRRVLLIGNAASRSMTGTDAAAARGNLHDIKHQNGQSRAVTSFHPRFLLERPQAKAEAWKDLMLLIRGIDA